MTSAAFRYIGQDRASEFLLKGYKQGWIFPHRVYYLPKCGPDGYKLATRMLGSCGLDGCWEAALFADPSTADEFPRELFGDRELVWDRRHFGRLGQIASANLVVNGRRVHSMVHISDMVQRIALARPDQTRIENRFEGWAAMLVNAVFNFARGAGARSVAFATADLSIRNTDPARQPERELFERIYDRRLHDVAEVTREGDWWIADVAAHADRTVQPDMCSEPVRDGKTICVSHDIERGLGHLTSDATRAEYADASAPGYFDRMMTIERNNGVKTTYNVAGCLLDELRTPIERDGHAIGFHSYDHVMEPARLGIFGRQRPAANGQLERCRDVDGRVRGYRPPQSKWTAELTEERLCYHNFEWLATSRHALEGLDKPIMHKRMVKIPIWTDDYPLYRGQAYADWEARLLADVDRAPFFAFSLHDCYGDFWLEHYPRLLDALRARGTFRTFDEVADDVIFASGSAGPAQS